MNADAPHSTRASCADYQQLPPAPDPDPRERIRPNRLMRYAIVLAAATLVAGLAMGSHARADVTYQYDADGRLTQVENGNGQGVTYVYDPDGNITGVNPFTYPTPTATATP